MPGDIRIGISGWTYDGWRGAFYPSDLPHKHELAFASRQVNSIEINGTFYAMQKPTAFQAWYNAVPQDFVFAVKANRYITHIRRLNNIDEPLANFFASGILLLKEKLGPILWQFPPQMEFDPTRFEYFLASLPLDTSEAARISVNHSDWMSDRSVTTTDQRRPLRHAIEVRNKSFVTSKFIQMLRRYDAALVISEGAGTWPYIEDITSDFIYIRLHGIGELYSGGYSPTALDVWAKKIRKWKSMQPQHARDVFVYFNNDAKAHAPFNAMSLLERLTHFKPAYYALQKAA